MKLYFAYGSNMAKYRMRELCPQSRRVGLAQLLNWRWIVGADGYANIIPCQGDFVTGTLFEIGYSDEAALDDSDETGLGVYGKRSLPLLFNSRTLLALCYAKSDVREGMASLHYGQQLSAACSDAGIGNEYWERNISRFLPRIAA